MLWISNTAKATVRNKFCVILQPSAGSHQRSKIFPSAWKSENTKKPITKKSGGSEEGVSPKGCQEAQAFVRLSLAALKAVTTHLTSQEATAGPELPAHTPPFSFFQSSETYTTSQQKKCQQAKPCPFPPTKKLHFLSSSNYCCKVNQLYMKVITPAPKVAIKGREWKSSSDVNVIACRVWRAPGVGMVFYSAVPISWRTPAVNQQCSTKTSLLAPPDDVVLLGCSPRGHEHHQEGTHFSWWTSPGLRDIPHYTLVTQGWQGTSSGHQVLLCAAALLSPQTRSCSSSPSQPTGPPVRVAVYHTVPLVDGVWTTVGGNGTFINIRIASSGSVLNPVTFALLSLGSMRSILAE